MSVGVAGALAVASLGAVGCSSSDTILALTITAGDGVAQVSKIHVAITPASGAVVPKDIVPPTKDGGAIQASFFDRITLPESAEGEAMVRADALDANGTSFAWGTTTADIQKNHAVAAQVKLFVGGPPPPSPDGGVGGNGGSGEAGAGGGAAGAAGGHAGGAGGHAGGGGGHAGAGGEAAGGAGGRRGNGNGKAGAGGA